MYNWFSRVLQERPDVIQEEPFKPVPPKELSVYDEQHPRPKDELPADRLREVMTEASDARMARLFPKDAESLKEFRKVVGTAVRALVDAGYAVVAPDVLGTGELTPEKPFPVDKNFAGYTYGYNRTLLANRVHDVLTFLAFGRGHLQAKAVHLVGWGEMGPVAI